MRLLATISLACVLSACSATETNETVQEAESADSVAGRYEVSRPDGSGFISVINADGTYSEIVDGEESVTGKWEAMGERTCYDPDGPMEPVCYTFGEPGEPAPEGAFSAIAEDGTTFLVRPLEN